MIIGDDIVEILRTSNISKISMATKIHANTLYRIRWKEARRMRDPTYQKLVEYLNANRQA